MTGKGDYSGGGYPGVASVGGDTSAYPSDGSPISLYRNLQGRLQDMLNWGSAGTTGDELAEAKLQPGDLIFSMQAETVAKARKGVLLCDGTSVSQIDYRQLYANIGDLPSPPHGAPPAGSFWLPDFRGLSPMMAYVFNANAPALTPTDLAVLDVGDRIGSEDTVLIPGNLPQHSHPSPNPSYPFGTLNDPAAGFFAAPGTIGSIALKGESNTGVFPGGPPGAADSFSSRTPSMACLFLIKT